MHSLAHAPKGTPSEYLAVPLRPSVSIRFQILFHSPRRGSFHLSLTVLLPYRSPAVFSLGAWSPPLPAGFRVSCGTQGFCPRLDPWVRDSHPLPSAFPDRSPSVSTVAAEPFNPSSHVSRFGLLGVRSPLLAESSLFLALLRCFSSRTDLPLRDAPLASSAGFPIRTSPLHLACTRLGGAFRSVPRPSSAAGGQASPGCSSSLTTPCCGEIDPLACELLRVCTC